MRSLSSNSTFSRSFGEKNYQELFKKESEEFWALQQIKQTPEEEQYALLCQKLKQMCEEYREEIDRYASENIELQEKYDEFLALQQDLSDKQAEEEHLREISKMF